MPAAFQPAAPKPFPSLLSETLATQDGKVAAGGTSLKDRTLAPVNKSDQKEGGARPSFAPHRYSFDAVIGQAVSTSFRSAAPYSAQLSPITEIRNMISP